MNEDQKTPMVQVKLPIKSKIAVWWLIVFGVLLAIWTLEFWLIVSNFADNGGPDVIVSFGFFIPVVGSIFAIYSGVYLSKKSKRAWKVAVIALVIAMICSLVGCCSYLSTNNGDSSIETIIAVVTSVFLLAEPIIPLVLIILDRKNYFEMVRQRELEKAQSTE